MQFIQEAVDLSSGKNLQPNPNQYHLPDQQNGVVVFLLAGSYEYDLELIKKMPPPRTNYKNIIIPFSIMGKVGVSQFKYTINSAKYNERVQYLQKQKMVPKLVVLKPPINKISNENVYVPISDVVNQLNQNIRGLSPEYMEKNAMNVLNQFMQMFPNTKRKIWMVDADRFKIYDGENRDAMCSDMINGILGAYLTESKSMKTAQDVTFIFKSSGNDYKMDLRSMDVSDHERLHEMCEAIGTPFRSKHTTQAADDSELDNMLDELNAPVDNEAGESTDDQQQPRKSGNLKQSIQALKDRYGVEDQTKAERDSMYDAKTFQINAALLHRITPNAESISDYKRISQDLSQGGDHPVEDEILNQASKELSSSRASSNEDSVMNTTSSPREFQLRSNIGQVRLKNLNMSALSSVTDVPMPPPQRPIKLTTTNRGAMVGTSFANIAKEYEDKMLDQDIVATFMTLQKLPEGFVVTNVEVEDISTSVSLIHNWKVSLKNKRSGTQSHINIRVPKVINGRFLYNGTCYNIGKQDFPIPILKINKKLVMLTSNYNKISVSRYDTKSLVDLTQMMKAVATANNADGTNPYVKTGTSTVTNSRFVSTIEYDEYARRWYSFENKETGCRIVFNRDQCLREFDFVTVQENEFCIGMINQVPVVMNTETGLDRHGRSITDILLSVLPDDLRRVFNKIKPTKLSMYAEIKLGSKFPLGVAIAAWEGLTSLLKRSGCQYKFINPREDAPGFLKFPFKDKTLAVQMTLLNQLIFNGFYRINTKDYTVAQFDTPIMDSNSVFVDIFNQLFFKQYSQLTMFITNYTFFVDAITEDVCNHYHIPSNLCDMLLYAANMLADNNFKSETNSSLYRIRSSEIIPAIIHESLAHAISRYNNAVGSKNRDNKLNFNSNEVLNQLTKIETVSPISALNPMVELHERETISMKGFHGVNDDRAYTRAKRSYEESMVGKMAMSSPNSGNVGINRQLVADPKVESVRGYTSTKGIDTDFNDLQLASFSELLTPGTVSRDDAIRTAIATSQTSHIVATDDAEPVLISNGVDELAPSYLSDEFAVMAQEDGKVLEISDGYMIVQYQSGKKQAIPIMDRYSFNTGSGFHVNNKLQTNFEANDTFQKNDILAYHEKFFSKDSSGMVRLNIGPLAKVAFCGLYSTYEDAGLITAKMSKRLSTHITMQQATKLNATDDIESIVKVGDEVEIGDPLIVFGLGDTGDKSVDNFLKAFQGTGTDLLDTAKRVVKSKHPGRVADVRIYTVKSLDKLSPSLFEIVDAHFKENIQKRRILDKHDKSSSVYKLDTMYSLPTAPMKGSSIKGINCDVLVEIYIEHGDEVSVGDKCVVYAASKQVISEVIPEGQEPYAESTPDEEVSMFVAPSSILKRMIPSVLVTASANKVLIELKKQIRKIWES